MADKDSLGDRMKMYEGYETSRKFLPGLPVYARIDGRGFSKFTKGMNRPYDTRMTNAMVEATKYLVKETHARIGYVQSDEISLIWQAGDHTSQILFDGKIAKLTSVLAGMATAAFTRAVLTDPNGLAEYADRLPHFDARVIQLPNQHEATAMMLWRNQDATKNAVSMAAHHYFGHNAILGMNGPAKQEKLFQEAGVNFNDYPEAFKRGTFVRRKTVEREFTEEELANIPEKARPEPGTVITRTAIVEVSAPPMSKIANRIDFIFNGADPEAFEEEAEA